jgi:hypothetical protein
MVSFSLGRLVVMKYLKDNAQLLSWSANIVTILGVILTSRNIYPLNLVVLSAACVLWILTGIVWRKPELWSLNAVILLIYLSGFIK